MVYATYCRHTAPYCGLWRINIDPSCMQTITQISDPALNGTLPLVVTTAVLIDETRMRTQVVLAWVSVLALTSVLLRSAKLSSDYRPGGGPTAPIGRSHGVCGACKRVVGVRGSGKHHNADNRLLLPC